MVCCRVNSPAKGERRVRKLSDGKRSSLKEAGSPPFGGNSAVVTQASHNGGKFDNSTSRFLRSGLCARETQCCERPKTELPQRCLQQVNSPYEGAQGKIPRADSGGRGDRAA